MDEFRQNNRLRGALDAALSGLNGDPALAQRVLRCAEEKPRAAKKLSVGLVFALVALLAATGIAAAAALNLFEKFGQNDRRFAEIAPQTAISAESSVAQTEKTGTVAASITNAYYDGESLLIGYSIQGFSSFEPFSPTDEQLARMRPTDAVPARLNESHLAEAFEAAQQAATPWGMATYRVAVSDHTYTDDGLDLGPWTETEDASDPDCLLAIRDFDALPETAKNRDSLSLHAAVYQYAVFDYFDGHSMYTTTERTELFPLTATVNRISRDSALFTGVDEASCENMLRCFSAYEQRFSAGQTILTCGQQQDMIGVLLSGSAALLRLHADGNRTVLESMDEGSVFGEELAFTGFRDGSALIECREDCRVIFMRYDQITKRCENACACHSQVVTNLFQLLSKKSLHLSRRIEVLACRSIREKLLCFFEQLADEHGSRTFPLPFSLSMLAEYISADRSAMMREMRKMREEDLISTEGRSVTLL